MAALLSENRAKDNGILGARRCGGSANDLPIAREA